MSSREDNSSDDNESKWEWAIGLYETVAQADRSLSGMSSPLEPLPLDGLTLPGSESYSDKVLHARPSTLSEKDGASLPASEPAEDASFVEGLLNDAPCRRQKRKQSESTSIDIDSFFPTTGRRKKKPPGTPKRPLSAYNYFFKEERERLMRSKGEHGLSVEASGKISFQDLGRHIGAKWNGMSEQQRQKYRDLAEKDVERYRREMAEFDKSQAEREAAALLRGSLTTNPSVAAPLYSGESGFPPPYYLPHTTSGPVHGFASGMNQDQSVPYAPISYASIPERPRPTFPEVPPFPMLPPGTEVMVVGADGVERRQIINYCAFMVTPEEAQAYLATLPTGYSVVHGPPPPMNHHQGQSASAGAAPSDSAAYPSSYQDQARHPPYSPYEYQRGYYY